MFTKSTYTTPPPCTLFLWSFFLSIMQLLLTFQFQIMFTPNYLFTIKLKFNVLHHLQSLNKLVYTKAQVYISDNYIIQLYFNLICPTFFNVKQRKHSNIIYVIYYLQISYIHFLMWNSLKQKLMYQHSTCLVKSCICNI